MLHSDSVLKYAGLQLAKNRNYNQNFLFKLFPKVLNFVMAHENNKYIRSED